MDAKRGRMRRHSTSTAVFGNILISLSLFLDREAEFLCRKNSMLALARNTIFNAPCPAGAQGMIRFSCS